MSENVGWHVQPDGSQRYWDGTQWLGNSIPAPTEAPTAKESSSGRNTTQNDTTNAGSAEGWHAQPNGSHWYWDGAQWTGQAPGENPTERPSENPGGGKASGARGWIIAAIVVVVIAFGAMVFWPSDSSDTAGGGDDPLTAQAYRACDAQLTDSEMLWASILPDGSVELDGGIQGLGEKVAACILGRLGTPGRITSAMSSTNALAGVQTDSADGLNYRWSYHPDNGLDVIISQ